MECLQSFFITLINSGIFEYFAEYFSDFLLKDLFNILLCDGCVIRKEFIYPVSVFCNLFIAADIFFCQDVIFQKKLLFFLPFYVIRYEKSREDIEKDPEKLQKLLDEYVTISRRLEESLLENGKEALHRYLVEVIIKIADYIFSDSEKTKKGVDRAMGGEVLELKTDKLINEIRQDVKEEVKAEVKEEVKTETKEKIVICMLKRGKSTLEEIAADTQMPIEQVERIKKEQQL